jgi:alpha-galactosidase
MQEALNRTGRPIVYSINSPEGQVNTTNPSYANLWRTTGDTSNTFTSMLSTAWNNNNATHIVSGSTGAWNDADMLGKPCEHLFLYPWFA